MNDLPEKPLEQIIAETTYPAEAFQFVQRGLDYTVQQIHGPTPETSDDNDQYHVNGGDLSKGLKEFAQYRYGALASTILRRWGIEQTDDFGQIVFAMVDGGYMRTTDGDHQSDFEGLFDLHQTLAQYTISMDMVPKEGVSSKKLFDE